MTRTPQNTSGDELLPRPPGVFRRWLAAHPRAVDWTIVGFYLFGCALVVLFELLAGVAVGTMSDVDPAAAEQLGMRTAALTWPWVLVSVLAIGLVAVALLYRRRFPLAGVVLTSLLLFFELGLLAAPNSVALVFLLYAVPVYRSVKAGWIAFGIALLSGVIVLQLTGGTGTGLIGPGGLVIADGPISSADRVGLNLANGLWLLAVLMIGINLGNRRRYVEALIDRAHQLAREREQKAQLAAAAERARIAREMHDIVAHSLSVVVTLSEAASVAVETQPAAAKHAMERAAETGRSALVEMRRLLGVLNEGEGSASDESPARAGAGHAPRAPQPGAAELQGLVDGFREAGLRVALTEQGVPAGDAVQQLAVFRIVQEALTNALRHAGAGASVDAVLEHSPEGTRIEIVDSGREAHADAPGPSLPGSGRGLEGARQRAGMFGGVVEAGPFGAGWRVVATVPVGGAAPHGGAASEEER